MLRLLKRIKNKLYGPPPAVDYKQELINKKILKVGEGCDISNMTIMIYHKEEGVTNIEIGNNCCIKGIIIIYRPQAKVKIADNVYIGSMTYLECAQEIEIERDVLISMSCNIIDTNSHSTHSSERVHDIIDWQKGLEYKNWDVVFSDKVLIGNKSWIGLRSIIMKGVRLGEGTIVGSGSVVTKSTEAYTAVAGNPAVLIKKVD